MASPFQQQVRQRKFLYVGLILVLFTLSYGFRRAVIDRLADRLAIREESRGDVDLTGAVVRLGLTGSRGLATCILWNEAIDKQKKNQWNEMEVLVRSLTKLQPHFITPWLFQSWNLAYNVSVESDRVRDKYFYVTRGVELLAEGERQNTYHPDLRWSIGWYTQHKIMLSDEKNYKRSLLQLSMIPPNERDPARFWKQTDEGPVINYDEFEAFCRQHPQLVRRLREGIYRETAMERRKQFTCEKPEQVVQFLEENYNVPSLYRVEPLPANVAAHDRTWAPTKKDVLLDPISRFPVLPMEEVKFDPTAIVTDFQPRDDMDGYTVSHSWFSYAQEPLPEPSTELPGNPGPITDRARQRRPKHMTTLIFRNYPAQACRYMAERLQEEGWYGDEPWNAEEWFAEARSGAAGKDYKLGGGKPWSLEAWQRAFRAWEKHGEENLLLFRNPAQEQVMRQDAAKFAQVYRMKPNGEPEMIPDKEMTEEQKRWRRAAAYLFEYDFYRRVSHFAHHYLRCMMEERPETVAVRKLLYQAEQLETAGDVLQALEMYTRPIEVASVPAWAGKKMSPLEAWRELVLKSNKEFRRDSFTQEQTAEYELRYLRLQNRREGRVLKDKLAGLATVVPLLPPFKSTEFRAPITLGPFAGVDEEGYPWVDEGNRDVVLDRMGLMSRRKMLPSMGPEAVPPMMDSVPMPGRPGRPVMTTPNVSK
jgi:hypothetical protein